jgi:hypothetical protein
MFKTIWVVKTLKKIFHLKLFLYWLADTEQHYLPAWHYQSYWQQYSNCGLDIECFRAMPVALLASINLTNAWLALSSDV